MNKLHDEERAKKKAFTLAERQALKYCKGRKINVTKNTRELDALKKEYDKQEKEFLSSVNGQSYEAIRDQKCSKERLVQQLQNFVDFQETNVKQVISMVQKRKKFFITMRSTSLRGISRKFTDYMERHNLLGTLIPDYRNRLLVVQVRPKIRVDKNDHNEVEAEESQTNNFSLVSLSGGERSKTLVCLINSLWHAQQPPMRCLDEWDVYLDAVARKQMEIMLVRTASLTRFQYLFISPQGSIFSEDEIKKQFEEQYMKKINLFTVGK